MIILFFRGKEILLGIFFVGFRFFKGDVHRTRKILSNFGFSLEGGFLSILFRWMRICFLHYFVGGG